MKIALVCPFSMFGRPGGIPQAVRDLHAGLTEKGHTAKIITQRPASFKGDIPKDYILLGVTRTFNGGFGTEGNWAWPSDSEEIAEVLEREKFDVINFHEPWMPLLAWQMLKQSKAAHVGTFHSNLLDTGAGKFWTIFRPYGAPLIRSMDILTATSPTTAGMIIKKANMKSAKDRQLLKSMRYTPCSVDLKFFKPTKKRQALSGPNTKTIVFVGRLEKRKGVDWLIKAFAEVVKEMPEAHLILAGSGLWSNKMHQYVETQDIKNITFAGYVTDEQKLRLLQNADLTCFPSPYGEGFGIVLLEAMAVGTPIIAGNNMGYTTTMSGRGRIGLVDPQATADFANRLEVFLRDPEQRKLMVAWGLNEVKQYDYREVAKKYEAAYVEALKLKNKSKNGKLADEKESKKLIHRLLIRRHA